MTDDYWRMVRSEFLQDTSISPDAFRVLSYMMAQARGFTFKLVHLQRVFKGQIGRDRLEAARAELMRSHYLIPGARHKVDGGFIKDGATVNWRKVCLPTADPHPEYPHPEIQGPENPGDRTSDESPSDESPRNMNMTCTDPWHPHGCGCP